MVEYEEIRKRYFYEGVELASFVGRYPAKEKYPDIGKFYEELTKSSYEWFCSELCEALRKKYDANDDEKKRFRCEVCRYEASFLLTEEESFLSVSCNVTLSRGKKRVLARFFEEQRWNKEGTAMIKHREEKKRRAK